MFKQPKTVRAIHANRGVEARYRKELDELIKEMSNSAEYWLRAQYRKAPPEVAMEAAAHGKSTLEIPQEVGEEFVKKDAE